MALDINVFGSPQPVVFLGLEGIPVLQIAVIFVATIITQTTPPAGAASPRVPEILERAILQRTGFKTAAISYRRESKYPRRARKVENNEVRLTESEEYVVEHGDDDGILSHGMDGGPAFGVRNMSLPRETLFDHVAQKTWGHWNSYETFDLRNIDSITDRLDLRTVGILYYEKRDATPKDILNELAARKDLSFNVTPASEGIVRVTATSSEKSPFGRAVIEWLIDTKKGPSIINVATWCQKQGEARTMECECRTTLTEVEGRWWPNIVEIKFPDSSGGIRYDFKTVEFDRPTHPKTLDPDFMGIPAGAVVYNVTITPSQPEQHCYVGNGNTVPRVVWNGIKDQHDLEPLRQFEERMRAMGSGYFPNWWNLDAADLGLEGLPDRPDLWEAYVRRWVLRHTSSHSWVVLEPLTDAQKTAALAALSDCRRKAIPILSRCDAEAKPLRAELAMLVKKQNEFASDSAPPPVDDKLPSTSQPAASTADVTRSEMERLRVRLAELEHSREIAALFELLKTRLNGILTTKQRDPMNGAFEKPVLKMVRLPNGRFQHVPSTERERVRSSSN